MTNKRKSDCVLFSQPRIWSEVTPIVSEDVNCCFCSLIVSNPEPSITKKQH